MKELDDISDEHKQCDVFLNGFFYFSNIVAWNGMRLIAQYLIKGGKTCEFVDNEGRSQNTGRGRIGWLFTECFALLHYFFP